MIAEDNSEEGVMEAVSQSSYEEEDDDESSNST